MLTEVEAQLTVRRGAIVKAMAICTRHSFIEIFKVCPPVHLAPTKAEP